MTDLDLETRPDCHATQSWWLCRGRQLVEARESEIPGFLAPILHGMVLDLREICGTTHSNPIFYKEKFVQNA